MTSYASHNIHYYHGKNAQLQMNENNSWSKMQKKPPCATGYIFNKKETT